MSLSIRDKSFLAMFRFFYGTNYPALIENNTEAHVKAQKMGYLLSMANFELGDYGYILDTFGPYSSAFQNDLKNLDTLNSEVTSFYEHFDDSEIFTDETNLCGLFSVSLKDKIQKIINILQLRKHETDIRSWCELLGTIAFVSNSIVPGATFTEAHQALIKIKPRFNNYDENKSAWDSLVSANIIAE